MKKIHGACNCIALADRGAHYLRLFPGLGDDRYPWLSTIQTSILHMASVDWRHHIRIRRAARLVAPPPSRASSAEHGGPLAAPRRLFHACPALFIDARDSIVRLSDEPGCRKARRLS